MRVNRSSFSKKFYLLSRDLHLYIGLFSSPFVLVFALSTILLNHNLNSPGGHVEEWDAGRVELGEGMEPRQQGFHVLEQLHMQGEMGMARQVPAAQAQLFPGKEVFVVGFSKPGQNSRVEVDPATGQARIRQNTPGVMRALIEMHMRPGPHAPRSNMNWVFSKVWAFLSDTFVYMLFFLSISGIYLWYVLRSERRIGWIMVTAGVVSFSFLLAGFLWG